jgi:iron complex outermembrane recepter protein
VLSSFEEKLTFPQSRMRADEAFSKQILSKGTIRMRIFPALLFCLLVGPGFVWAEDQASEGTGSGETKILDEVFVTATKEEEFLKDIAGDVGVVKKETIENTTSNGLHEVLKFMPGVTVQNRFGTDDVNISIRGSGIRQSFGVRGIQVLVDGIPLTEPDGQTRLDLIDMATIERIEVVKGPASTIYGGNASGGVVNLITKKGTPGSGFNAEAGAWLGSYGYGKGYASVYGSEGRIRYFAGLSHFNNDGYRDHSDTDGQKFNANMGIDINDKSSLQFFVAAGQVDILLPGTLTLDEMLQNPQQANVTAVNRNANRFDDRFRLGVLYENQLTTHLKGTVSGYWDWRQLEHIPVFRFLEISRIGTGGDIRLLYDRPIGRFANKFIVGTSLQYQSQRENDYGPTNDGSGRRGPLVADENQFLDNYGVYVQDQFFITKDLSVTAGVRYSEYSFELEDHFLSDGNDSGDVDYERYTPRVGVSWTPIKEVNLFANYSTAFQTPTLSEVTSGGGTGFIPLNPEKIENYEIGSRGEFTLLGRPVAFELTFFRMDIEDKILSENSGFPTFITTFKNKGDTRQQGISAGLGVDITRSLNAQVSYTYSNFKFTAGQFDGKRVPGQTPHQVLAALYYKFFLRQNAFLRLGAELRHSDDYFVDDDNTFRNGDWSTVALKMEYKRDRFGAGLVVDNLTDEIYSDAVTLNSSSGNFYNPANGFTITGNVSWRF